MIEERTDSSQALTATQSKLAAPRMRFLLLAISLLGCVAVGVLISAVPRAPNYANQKTREHFEDIATCLHRYDYTYGHLPYSVRRKSIGRPTVLGSSNGTSDALYSWRVETARMLNDLDCPWEPSQPWDSPANAKLARDCGFLFCYERSSSASSNAGPLTETNALAITGPITAWGDGQETRKSLKEIPPSTILVVEVRSSGIHWMQPGDFDIRTMPQTINAPDGRGISSRHVGGFHVIFADRKVWFLSDKIPFATLKKFFTVADAAKYDREKELGPYALDRGP